MTHQEALKKVMKFCAYQDRCQKEVRNKLFEIEAPYDAIEHIIAELIDENFINEERFATSYARGKFYFKKWGKKKIELELKARDISNYCIKKAMHEIQEEDYIQTLQKLTEQKFQSLGNIKEISNKQKLYTYLYNKGYESDLIWDSINQLYESKK